MSIPSPLRAFLRRHSSWAVLLAVIAPLCVLLALQYRSLVRLERLSAVAHQAAMDQYLEAVAGEVRDFYETGAERALNLPVSVFRDSCWDEASFHFKKKGVEGARLLFLVSFVEGDYERMVFFDPRGEQVGIDPYSREYRAIYVAAASWSVLGKKGIPVGPVSLAIDERDPAHRIILNPITDALDADTARIVGVAGMVVDGDHFSRVLLPETLTRALPAFFPEPSGALPTVTVRDGAGRLVYATGPRAEKLLRIEDPPPEDESRELPFVFTDWRIGLLAHAAAAERVARASFLVNLGLTGLIGLVLLAGVVLALRTAARAVRLSEMKTDFVSNVSHELRTPLASIRAFGELLALGRARDEKAREYGSRIEAESRRLTTLIHDILDFSHLESGRKSLRLEPLDAGEVVAGVVEGARAAVEEKGFDLELRRPGRALPVRGDEAALGRVVSNLLDNAVKYSTDDRRIEVTVGVAEAAERRSPRGGPWVKVAVTDRGIGIERDEQARIFERFHRVANGLVHDVKGSGLGLALVDQVVRAHGGRVTVESELRRGSTFTVWLPLERAEGRGAEMIEEPAAGG